VRCQEVLIEFERSSDLAERPFAVARIDGGASRCQPGLESLPPLPCVHALQRCKRSSGSTVDEVV
jgi:hypothetical protein